MTTEVTGSMAIRTEQIPRPVFGSPSPTEKDQKLSQLLQATLDALGIPVALLNQKGQIIGNNTVWRRSERNPFIAAGVASYLSVCRALTNESDAAALRDGLLSILLGRRKVFECVCCVQQDDASRHFRVRIKRLESLDPPRFLVSHDEVTELTRAREAAREAGARVFEAQLLERKRLAMELHDSIGQNLVSLGLWLSRLRMETPHKSAVEKIISDMSATLQEAHTQIRTLSYLFEPPWPEQEGGFENAVRQFVRGFGERAGLTTEVQLHGPPCRMSRSGELTLFRILQEAFVNIHRHAHATFTSVELTNRLKEVTLQIKDDGCGFTGARGVDAALGTGLTGMRARLMDFGGELTIGSCAKGTTLKATLPITSQRADRKFFISGHRTRPRAANNRCPDVTSDVETNSTQRDP